MEVAKYVFDEFELDAAAFELRRSGERVHLERIPMELLLLLVSRYGDVVSRELILEKLWGEEIFIDSNTAINVAIRKVRKALDDNIESPRYILTVPAKGYRFIGSISSDACVEEAALSVAIAGDIEAGPATDSEQTKTAIGLESGHGRKSSAFWRWLIGSAAAIVLAIGLWTARKRPPAPPGKVMFAVLPFVNLTGDPAQEYIADGMTEEMIAQMGALNPERIGVIARTSAMRFKGTHKGAAEIARELGASYLLEGSIRHEGERMRVTAQLIQASDETHLWAANYDRDFSDLLQVESEIADAIAGQVQVNLAGHKPQFTGPVPPEAQAAYLRGRAELNLRTKSSIANAVIDFKQAIALDPDYPLPYTALAICYVLGPIFGVGDPMVTMPQARELATHALRLDPNLAEAHSVLGMVAAHYDYDWPTAKVEFLTALRINPSDPYAHFFYSNSFLSPHGRHQEAIDEVKQAIALDPLSSVLQAYLIRTYVWARRDGDAHSQLEKTNRVAPNLAVLHERGARLFAYEGNFKAAIEEDATARLNSGEPAEEVISKKELQLNALAQRGAQGYWEAQLDLARQQPNPPEAFVSDFGLAVIYARLGKKELALQALEEAFARRDVLLTEINIEPAFDVLRQEPRFGALLRRVHLA